MKLILRECLVVLKISLTFTVVAVSWLMSFYVDRYATGFAVIASSGALYATYVNVRAFFKRPRMHKKDFSEIYSFLGLEAKDREIEIRKGPRDTEVDAALASRLKTMTRRETTWSPFDSRAKDFAQMDPKTRKLTCTVVTFFSCLIVCIPLLFVTEVLLGDHVDPPTTTQTQDVSPFPLGGPGYAAK